MDLEPSPELSVLGIGTSNAELQVLKSRPALPFFALNRQFRAESAAYITALEYKKGKVMMSLDGLEYTLTAWAI